MHDGLLAADACIRSDPELRHTLNLLVAQHGQIVCERYYRGSGPDDLQDTHSVTKSFTSTVVGVLAGAGLVDLDAPVSSLLDAPAFSTDAVKTAITVRHLLTMRSGLYGWGWWDIDELEDRGVPVVEGALDAPLVGPPGWGFLYNNGASHVLSSVIEKVAGGPAADVAAELLFRPLAIDRWSWPADPQGVHWGCGGLQLAGRDLLKLGLLYLAGGRWNGRQVVGEDYVRSATSPAPGGPPEFCGYGLLWWVADRATPPLYFAAGHGGQYVVVVPDLELVVVTMTDARAVAQPKGIPLRRLITETIVPAFDPTQRA